MSIVENHFEQVRKELEKKLQAQKAVPRMAEMQPADTRAILNERGKTHGNFENQAHTSSLLKNTFVQGCQRANKIELPSAIQEGMAMILHKASRVACGDHMELDHYQDIAGYAQLIVDWLKAQKEKAEF